MPDSDGSSLTLERLLAFASSLSEADEAKAREASVDLAALPSIEDAASAVLEATAFARAAEGGSERPAVPDPCASGTGESSTLSLPPSFEAETAESASLDPRGPALPASPTLPVQNPNQGAEAPLAWAPEVPDLPRESGGESRDVAAGAPLEAPAAPSGSSSNRAAGPGAPSALESLGARRDSSTEAPPRCSAGDEPVPEAFFGDAPRSIVDGMEAAAGRRRVRWAVLAGAMAALLAGGVLAVSLTAKGGGAEPEPTSSPGAPAGVVEAEPSSDPAQTVLRYTVEGEGGAAYQVTEVVSLGDDGRCSTTEMSARFEDPSVAGAFAAGLERDFGSRCLSVRVDGTEVQAVLDVSSLGYDAATYEAAVRAASRGLEVE